ncbi:alanine racemase [candidate division KSB1 bacterium]|nr:alanine racemase [candidate division KSB1 bacterium]
MRPTVAEIDLDAVAFNLEGIRKKVSPADIMAVVKADAYGHGALEVSRLALGKGARYLGVALVDEGVQLRQAGIDAPILIFGGSYTKEAQLFVDHQLEATVYDKKSLQALEGAAKRANRPAKVQVKIDTGMGRVGIHWQHCLPFFEHIARSEAVQLNGVYTHFATSDMMDKSFACLQLARFNQVLKELKSRGIKAPIVHAANSGAILDMPESYFDLVRPGVMMYGYYPSKETTESIALQPAMTFKTRVLHVKTIGRGESVSYGRKFIARVDTRIVTLPVGYADGYNRLLSERGQVLIRGRRYPVVGRVCMDLIMADVGEDHTIRIGEEAVLFGRQGQEQISVQSICDKLDTIPYEVTCWISKRVPRIYIQK